LKKGSGKKGKKNSFLMDICGREKEDLPEKASMES